MRVSTWTRRLTAMLGVLLIPLLALVTTGAAQALPLATYADTSVTVLNGFADHGPLVTATLPVDAPPVAPTIDFTASGGFGAHAFSVTPATENGEGLSITAGGALVLTPVPGATLTPLTSPESFTVYAKDALGAIGADVVTVTPLVGGNLHYSEVLDNVTSLHGTNDNTTGQVDFAASSIPSTDVTESFTAGNLPGGTVLSGNGILTASSTIPGSYHSVTVTAADGAGAAAVEDIAITIKGGVLHVAVPRLSQGHAVTIAPTREDVYFVQSGAPSWDHFQIVGPGAINGHEGWVDGHLGLNVGVYSGLEYHHTYAVYFTPVTGQGSETPIPGSHGGHVTFISGAA